VALADGDRLVAALESEGYHPTARKLA
jgi:hypothetical protein